MRKNLLQIFFLLLGISMFAAPVVMSVTRGSIPFFDWLVLWSYLYWPTYLIGLVLITFSAVRLAENRAK